MDGILELGNKKGINCLNMEYHGIYTHLKNQEINMLHTLLHGKSSIKAAALKTKKEEFQEIKKEKNKRMGDGIELNENRYHRALQM